MVGRDSVEPTNRLRLGCVKYLNARPLVRGWEGEVVFDHPVVLCQRLAKGELDVALVSSFEFLRNSIYKIVDDISIASAGPVYSVFVAHTPGPLPREIELDPASATGAALLRCLMAERGLEFSAVAMSPDKLSSLPPGRGRFLIGDQAIQFRQKFAAAYEYCDLGEEWRNMTKLPFVYALWLIRPEVIDAKSVARQLRALRDRNLSAIDQLIREQKSVDPDFCRTYFRDYLRFRLGDDEKECLRMFHRLCVKHGLLPDREVELMFV